MTGEVDCGGMSSLYGLDCLGMGMVGEGLQMCL